MGWVEVLDREIIYKKVAQVLCNMSNHTNISTLSMVDTDGEVNVRVYGQVCKGWVEVE
jgi:hypothetical protein